MTLLLLEGNYEKFSWGKKTEVKKILILSSKSVSYVLSVGKKKKKLECKEMPDENKGRGNLLLLP